MKCFAVLFVSWMISEGSGQQTASLSVMSLIGSQIEFLEDKCFNQTNATTVFENLKETVDHFLSQSFNGSELILTTDTDPEKLYDMYSTQCNEPAAIRFRNDTNNKFKFLLRQCLNDNESLAFDKIQDIAIRIFDVMCRLEQEKMKNFFSLKGQECLSDNVITIGFCFLSVFPDDDEDREDFFFRLIDGQECKIIDEIEDCIVVELELCEESSVSLIFKRLFEFFKSELDCVVPIEGLQEDEKSSSSTFLRVPSMIPLTSGFIALLLFIH